MTSSGHLQYGIVVHIGFLTWQKDVVYIQLLALSSDTFIRCFWHDEVCNNYYCHDALHSETSEDSVEFAWGRTAARAVRQSKVLCAIIAMEY